MDIEQGMTDEEANGQETGRVNRPVERLVNCPKCGDGNLLVRYVANNEVVNVHSRTPEDNDFVYSYQISDFGYKITAEKEHLKMLCRNCQYEWRTNVIGS